MLIQWRIFLACVLITAVFTLDHAAEKKTSLIEIPEEESHTRNGNCNAIKATSQTSKIYYDANINSCNTYEISPRVGEDQLVELIECLREKLLNGIPQLGISTFDPFKFPLLPLPLRTQYFSTFMLLRRLRLDGIAGFEITNVAINIAVLPPKITLEIGLKFKKLQLAFRYWGNMNLFQMIDIFGKGDFSILFEDTDISLRAAVGLPVQITEFSLGLSLPTTTANITGLFRDEYMSNIISRQLSDTLTLLAEEEERRINDFINSAIWAAVIPPINEFIKNLTFDDIIGIITGGGGSCDAAMLSIVQAVNLTLVDIMNYCSYPVPLDNSEEYIKKILLKSDLENDI